MIERRAIDAIFDDVGPGGAVFLVAMLVVLGEGLSAREAVAIGLVVVASAGAARRAAREAVRD